MDREDVLGGDEQVRLDGVAREEGGEDEGDVVVVGLELPRRRYLLAEVEQRCQDVSRYPEDVEELVARRRPGREVDPEEALARSKLRDPRSVESDDDLAHAREARSRGRRQRPRSATSREAASASGTDPFEGPRRTLPARAGSAALPFSPRARPPRRRSRRPSQPTTTSRSSLGRAPSRAVAEPPGGRRDAAPRPRASGA